MLSKENTQEDNDVLPLIKFIIAAPHSIEKILTVYEWRYKVKPEIIKRSNNISDEEDEKVNLKKSFFDFF